MIRLHGRACASFPKGTKVVVFDIDGTLTTDDMELFKDIIDDLYEPMYDD